MLHRLHRIAASVIGVFVALHLANHLAALHSARAHIDIMDGLRLVYRKRVVELVLLACVLFQVCSGIVMVRARRGQRHGFFERLQAASGAYLAFFLIVHVTAVLFGRAVLELDPNFYYAAAGMHIAPYAWFIVPYYFLAVLALFGHLACAFHWLARERFTDPVRDRVARGVVVVGVVVSGLIVAAFGGAFHGVDIPPAYQAIYVRA